MKNHEIKILAFAYDITKDDFYRGVFFQDTGDLLRVEKVLTNEFRERFAQSVAERIVKDWDKIVFNDIREYREDGIVHYEARMYIGVKKEE